ncbi:MAG: DUF3784 domain-containing protein [Coprobacillus sp.]
MLLWVIIALFGAISVMFLMGKGGFLIAGYNTSSPEQKAMYDEKKLCRVMGVCTSIITLSLLVGHLNDDLAPYSIFGGVVIGLIIISVGNNKYAKKKNYEWIETNKDKTKWYRNAHFFKMIISIVVAIGVGIIMFTGSISIEFGDNSLTAKSFMASSITVEYKDIEDIQYQKDIELGSRTWGVGSFKIQAGNFKNDEFGKYKLYSYANCHDYVVIKTKDTYVVLNDVDEEKTKTTYEKIQQLIQ